MVRTRVRQPRDSAGRVTGLQQHMYIRSAGQPWHHGWGSPANGQMPCRDLPTIVGGRVVGSHQVCS
jgi:hypothetical protein